MNIQHKRRIEELEAEVERLKSERDGALQIAEGCNQTSGIWRGAVHRAEARAEAAELRADQAETATRRQTIWEYCFEPIRNADDSVWMRCRYCGETGEYIPSQLPHHAQCKVGIELRALASPPALRGTREGETP